MTEWPLSNVVTDMRPGLWVRRGSPPQMLSMHRHDDVEVNLVLEGQLHYLFGGRPLTIHEGEIAVFWAAQPHGLVDSRAGDMCWVHVPFSMLLGWGLPEAETAPLLAARPVITHAPELAIHVAGLAERWVDEVGAESPGDAREPDDDAQIALLEIQAAVRRILRAGSRSPDVDSLSGAGSTIPSGRLRQVGAMARFVMENHRSPLRIADIADSVHLAPSHAMTVFRHTTGVTLGEYTTMCRVAEAQRLLITTEMSIAEISESAGFGSLSSFYHHMSAACGATPREYRRRRT